MVTRTPYLRLPRITPDRSVPFRTTIRFPHDLNFTNQLGEPFSFAAQSELSGTIWMQPTLGPLGQHAHPNPHLLQVDFDFPYAGRTRRYQGLVSQYDLWFANGTQTESGENFVPQVGPIDGMMDSREDASYLLPDGNLHTFRVKYSGGQYHLMFLPNGILVQCRYYDQVFIAETAIYYRKDFLDFLFQPAVRPYWDSGKLDDLEYHAEQFVFIE